MVPAGFQLREVSCTDAEALTRIGRLRVEVWAGEGSLAPGLRDTGVWLDDFDRVARHWTVVDGHGAVVAAARLTVHARTDDSPDGYVWRRAGRPLPEPVGNIAKLVVRRDARGQGLAGALNRLRVAEARAMGAGCLTVTASKENARLLAALGFVDSGLVVQFDNRPGVPFHALELKL